MYIYKHIICYRCTYFVVHIAITNRLLMGEDPHWERLGWGFSHHPQMREPNLG
jgi:hypothetical protein